MSTRLLKLASILRDYGHNNESIYLKKIAQEMLAEDWYKLIGLPQDAPQREVNNALRKLLYKYHPDQGGDPEILKRIISANEVLKDPNSRAIFDAELNAGKIGKGVRFRNTALNSNDLLKLLRQSDSPSQIHQELNKFINSKSKFTENEVKELNKIINNNKSLSKEIKAIFGNRLEKVIESAAEGATRDVVDDLISYAANGDSDSVNSQVRDFIETKPILTTEQTARLRSAIDNNPKILNAIKAEIKGDIRLLDEIKWDEAKALSQRAANGAAQGAAPSAQSAGQSAESSAQRATQQAEQSAAQGGAQGAAREAAMTADDLIAYVGNNKAWRVRLEIEKFIETRPNLTVEQTASLRSAIDNNPNLSPDFKGTIKGRIRSLNPEVWQAAKAPSQGARPSGQAAGQSAEQGAAQSAGQAEQAAAQRATQQAEQAGLQRATQSAEQAAAQRVTQQAEQVGLQRVTQQAEQAGLQRAVSRSGQAAENLAISTSRVAVNPAEISRLATVGRFVTGFVGGVILDIAGRFVIDALMSEEVKNGWDYNVNLTTSFADISGYIVKGGIGSIFDKNKKEVERSVIDYVSPAKQVQRIGQPYKGSGSPQPESRVFVPAGVVVELLLKGVNKSVMGTFSIGAPNAATGVVSISITDEMIKEAYTKAMAGDKDTEKALSSGSLATIAENQMKKVETSKELAKELFGTGALIGTTVSSSGGMAAFTAGGAQAAGAAIAGGSALAGAAAVAGILGAGYSGYRLGTAINNAFEARDIVIGRDTEAFFRNLARPATQWKYVVGLEQTQFVKNNVKEFNIQLATGKLYEKAGLFTPGKTGKLTSNSYDESMSNTTYSPATQTITVAGAGGYKNDGIFSPEKILVNLVFKDGKSISLYSPIMVNVEEGKRGCTVKEADIIARYNKKYPQNAVKGTPQQAQKPYSNLGGRVVAFKAYLFDVARKIGVTGDFTPQDVAVGDWDKKANDLMIRVVNRTYNTALQPNIAKKMSGQLGEGKSWKWSSIAPQIGYSPNLNGAIKYIQDLNKSNKYLQ